MLWKLLIALGLVAVIVGGAIWISHGSQWYSKDRERVETVVNDPLFGTSRTEVTFVEKYSFGLLPDDIGIARLHNSYAFVLGAGLTSIALGLFLKRKRRKL